jgi:phage tail tape-measure protein
MTKKTQVLFQKAALQAVVEAVTSTLGSAVSDVGSAVSDVGSAVGSEIGSEVGSEIGSEVGSDVGSAVGTDVGSAVVSDADKFLVYMWPKEESKKGNIEPGHFVAIVNHKMISDMFRSQKQLFYEPKEVSYDTLRLEL